jgi:hypothetical protein
MRRRTGTPLDPRQQPCDHVEGDVLNLSRRDAELLLAEGWASAVERRVASVVPLGA